MLIRTVSMFLWLFLIGSLGVGEVGAAQGDGPAWKPFRSEAGRFVVDMPGTPKVEHRQRRSFIGDIGIHIFVGLEHPDRYTVEYSDLPGLAVTFAGHGTIYNHAKGELLLKTLGKEKSFEKVTLNGLEGVRLIYETPLMNTHPTMHGEAYMFLVDKRLYVIDATVSIEHSQDKAHEFFKSFRVESN